MARASRPSPPPAQMQLAASLRTMRKRRGLTQAGLAERTGGAQAHISGIENGTYDPRTSTLIALAAALGCELMLVPKEKVAELRRSVSPSGRATTPASILDEVFVPEPEEDDGK
jgi:transcriptional regulator with XRE-family HTH domain